MARFKYSASNRSKGTRSRSFDRRSVGRKDFNRPGRDSREPERFNRRDSDRPERTKVICDSCGRSCEVPFKPSSSKPVYCNDCFNKNSRTSSSSRFSGSEQEFDKINRKLDKIIKMLNE